MNDFATSYARYAEAVARANSLNKGAVFDALASAGITHVFAEFDGIGDSGQIESLSARINDSPIDLPVTTVNMHSTSWNHAELRLQETTLATAIEDACYGFLEQTHAGWENNDGAYGEFTFHVAEAAQKKLDDIIQLHYQQQLEIAELRRHITELNTIIETRNLWRDGERRH
jgi:hypothetical protein